MSSSPINRFDLIGDSLIEIQENDDPLPQITIVEEQKKKECQSQCATDIRRELTCDSCEKNFCKHGGLVFDPLFRCFTCIHISIDHLEDRSVDAETVLFDGEVPVSQAGVEEGGLSVGQDQSEPEFNPEHFDFDF